MRIALAGFMAVGKSTVSKLLAEELCLACIDLDEEIERRVGMSISEMFLVSEIFFRRREQEALVDVLEQDNFVLALGGGALHFENNRHRIEADALLFTLQASWKTLQHRIANSSRPLSATAEELFRQRIDGYAQAGIQIETDNRSPEEVMKQIVTKLKEKKLC